MCCKVAELRLVTALPAQELLASQMLQRLVKSVPAKITPDSLGFINGFLEGMSAHQLTIGAEMNDMLAVATLNSQHNGIAIATRIFLLNKLVFLSSHGL